VHPKPKLASDQVRGALLCGGCRPSKANASFSPIELHVVSTHEDVAEDPTWCEQVDDFKANRTHGANTLVDDKVSTGESKVLRAKLEADAGKFLMARHHV